MRRNNYSRRSGYSRPRNSRPGYSRFAPTNKRKTTYQWSESDLVRTVDFSKRAVQANVDTEYEVTHKFEDFNIHNKVLQNIFNRNFSKPTPIQDQAIPQIINGRDIIGIANTGTGKTAAFLIPLINKVLFDNTQKVLIVAPTRELAEQIYEEFRSFSYGMGIYAGLIIGGSNMGKQIACLRRSPNFVIGTPGRIKDFIDRKMLDLSSFNNVVLDETDRMVDIGFVNEIKMFITLLPKERQSLFFSATISNKVQEILNSFVNDPVQINVKKRETTQNISQEIVRVKEGMNKLYTLQNLLTKSEFHKVIVFSNTKRSVQKLADELLRAGIKADAIHGDKRQYQRRSTLMRFKRNEITVLLATDVAARGLDIDDVSHVINYDLPNSYDDYIHRIGRTGRAEKSGVALSFVSTN